MNNSARAGNVEAGPASVAHVADYHNRYPGETVTLYTQVAAHQPVDHLTLTIVLPAGLALQDYRPPVEFPALMPTLDVDGGHQFLRWTLPMTLPANSRYEFRTIAVVPAVQAETALTSQATVANGQGATLDTEAVRIAVWPKSKYLKFLPAIYEQDDLMARFLMLFESFWSPIDAQIEAVENYFDPQMTPSHFLPWLGSWLDVELESHWSEARQRQLVQWAIALHRRRGTRWGLVKSLELYTGQSAEIVEQRSGNFVLGPQTRLGPEIALGHGNIPHTFIVTLRLPPVQADSPQEQKQLEEIRRRAIETIIDHHKPAHTVYVLRLEPLTPETAEATAQTGPRSPAGSEQKAGQAAIWFNQEES